MRVWQSNPVFFPGESHGQRSLRATVHRVTKSRTWLKQLRSMHIEGPLQILAWHLPAKVIKPCDLFSNKKMVENTLRERELLCLWAKHDPATGHKITKEEMILQGTISIFSAINQFNPSLFLHGSVLVWSRECLYRQRMWNTIGNYYATLIVADCGLPKMVHLWPNTLFDSLILYIIFWCVLTLAYINSKALKIISFLWSIEWWES